MTIYNWLTLLGVPGLLAAFAGFVRLQVKQNRAIKAGLQAMLRDRLLQAYHHCKNMGRADPDDRTNFENLYTQYQSLGGNGVMDDIRQKFFNLPM